MLAIMPASNAIELTPQISELLFKINPERVEFCLVFRPMDRLIAPCHAIPAPASPARG
jgi:hypothetical protein